MGWGAVDKLIRWAIVVLAAVVLYDGYHLWRTAQLNGALSLVEAGEAVDVDHPNIALAKGYAIQQAGKFDAALEAYAAIDAPDPHMRALIRYNLANLYFRRGLQYREQGADDLSLPLVELAKEHYRELLRADSEDWPARYNLELALRVSPEEDLEPPEEERNPEHNPRSAAGMQVRKRLP